MALFNASTLPWVSAVQRIADSASVSADSQMTQRAHISLRAAFQFFGGKRRWDFLRAEAAPQVVVAPFSITGVTAVTGQASAACPPGHGLATDDAIVGAVFLAGTRVSATAASGFGLSVAAVSASSNFAITAIRDMYDLPSDMRAGYGNYGVRLLGAQRTLQYFKRRAYDRRVTDEQSTDNPLWYDLFLAGTKSKVRLLPPPSAADVLLQRYYRRFTIASASASTTALDIPEDYEEFPIAWAKWHFLNDKSDAQSQRGQTWLSLAQEGLKQMLDDQADVPDDTLLMTPDHIVDPRSDKRDRKSVV